MDKEQILVKSRAEKVDEGVEYIASQGRRYGVAAMSIMFIVLVIFNFLHGQSNYAIYAMFWTYLGVEAYGMYKINRDNVRLLGAVMGTLAGVLFCICYIMNVL